MDENNKLLYQMLHAMNWGDGYNVVIEHCKRFTHPCTRYFKIKRPDGIFFNENDDDDENAYKGPPRMYVSEWMGKEKDWQHVGSSAVFGQMWEYYE